MADEYGFQKPQPDFANMRAKLRAIIDADNARKAAKAEAQAAKELAAKQKQERFAQQEMMPSAADVARQRTEVWAPEDTYEAEEETTAVQMTNGEVIFVTDIENKLDLFVKVRTPEVVVHVDNKKEFYIATGRFLYHWRERTDADGNIPEVKGLPKVAGPKVQRIKHDTFDEWRSGVINDGADISTHYRGQPEPRVGPSDYLGSSFRVRSRNEGTYGWEG